MRKIAVIAVALALPLSMAGLGTHVAGAESAPANPTTNTKSTNTATTNTQSTATATPAPASTPSTVTVQPGDTLSKLAAANNTTYMRLFNANPSIANPNLIYPGEKLCIPTNDEQLTSRTATPTTVTVTVKRGDTLASIAAANQVTAQRIYNANPSITNPNLIYPGQQIHIPQASEQLTDRAMPSAVSAAPARTTGQKTVVKQATAPRAQTVTRAVATAKVTAATSAASTGTPNNSAKAYIYQHESSNNPNATNSIGCYGLGQDCNGKLKALCGNNYACQDAFFDKYAAQRYGGWAGALAFWQSHHWW